MSLKEQLKDYIGDLKYDLNNSQKEYDKILNIIDEETREDWKQFRLKELANTAGQIDTLKGIIEVLEDMVK